MRSLKIRRLYSYNKAIEMNLEVSVSSLQLVKFWLMILLSGESAASVSCPHIFVHLYKRLMHLCVCACQSPRERHQSAWKDRCINPNASPACECSNIRAPIPIPSAFLSPPAAHLSLAFLPVSRRLHVSILSACPTAYTRATVSLPTAGFPLRVFIAHWIGCLWFFIARVQAPSTPTWMDQVHGIFPAFESGSSFDPSKVSFLLCLVSRVTSVVHVCVGADTMISHVCASVREHA